MAGARRIHAQGSPLKAVTNEDLRTHGVRDNQKSSETKKKSSNPTPKGGY